jgi:hypothetical protein
MMPPGTSPERPGNGGLDAVLAGLQRASFPMDKEQLCFAVGDLEIADPDGRQFAVRRLFERVDQDRFTSAEDVAHALRMAVALEADRVPPSESS